MSSNKTIHAPLEIRILEPMFTQEVVHLKIMPIGTTPRQLDEDSSSDANGMFGNNEKRVPKSQKSFVPTLDLRECLTASRGVQLCHRGAKKMVSIGPRSPSKASLRPSAEEKSS